MSKTLFKGLFKKLNFNEFKKKKSFHNNLAIKEVLIKPYNEFDKVLKTLKKNKLQNRVYLKGLFNKALKFYPG